MLYSGGIDEGGDFGMVGRAEAYNNYTIQG